MKIQFILLILSFILIISCKKDKEANENPINIPTPLTNSEMLTSSSWIISGLVVDPPLDWDGAGYMVSNIYNYMEPCKQDDILIFYANGNYKKTEGATKCDEWDMQDYEIGTWLFENDETSIKYTKTEGTCSNVLYRDIINISENQLILQYSLNNNNLRYTYTETYTPINN